MGKSSSLIGPLAMAGMATGVGRVAWGEGALRVDALLSPLLHSESASRILARSLARYPVLFSARREERHSLGFFLFPRIAKYNTCFFVVILACSRACCSSFFCVECFRGIIAQCSPSPPCFGTSILYFFFWNSKLRFQVLKAGGGECGVSNSCLALLCCAGSCTTLIRYLSLSSISQSSWKVLLSCTTLSYLSPACISQSS